MSLMDQGNIGNKIKEIRRKQNLTQREFAQKFGVTYQAVSKWENNKNIPDIMILRKICDTYQLDINELLSVNVQKEEKKNKDMKKIISLVFIFFGLVLIVIFSFHRENNFELRELSANCKNFTITGSIAYNKNKTAIHISNINYCGKKDTNIYKNMKCTLYEKNQNSKIKIDDYVYEKIGGATIEELLKNIKFNVHDYVKTCKSYTENSLELEISAINQKNQTITYKIPLKLEDGCVEP